MFLFIDMICRSVTRYYIYIYIYIFIYRKIVYVLKLQIQGGVLAVPQTKEENAWLFDTSKHRAHYCSGSVGASYMWLGANDIEEEGVWRYWESNEVLSWESEWRGDGPNGGIVENCLVMLAGTFPARWSDIACLDSYAFCVPCEFEALAVLYLKGPAVCPGSPFNLQYILGENRGGRPSFTGFFHSDIFWDLEKKSWVLQSIKVSQIFSVLYMVAILCFFFIVLLFINACL